MPYRKKKKEENNNNKKREREREGERRKRREEKKSGRGEKEKIVLFRTLLTGTLRPLSMLHLWGLGIMALLRLLQL